MPAAGPRSRKVPLLLVVVAVLGLAGSRAPFFAHGPDWSILSWEHCFLLSFPLVYENRKQLEPDATLPYWVVDQGNMRGHYHAGMGWIARIVGWVSHWTGSRGLWQVRLVGTFLAAVFVGALAWSLSTVWRFGSDRAQILIPLFICLFPPTLFLWATLTPEGHYYDSHFFYGLFLPFYVALCRGRLNAPAALAAGLLAGIATVYTFSNAVFLAALVVSLLLLSPHSWWRRLRDVGIALTAAAAVFGLLGQPHSALSRITASNDQLNAVAPKSMPLGVWLGQGYAADAFSEHLSCLLGFYGSGVFDGRGALGAAVVFGLCVAVVGGAGLLWMEGALAFVRVRRPTTSVQRRFLALNGILLGGFVASYLLFDPYTLPDDVYLNISYLLPAFPMVFVGVGALFHRLLAVRFKAVVWLTRIAGALLGTLLIAGWVHAYAENARPRMRPDFQRCDSMHIEGYYWDPPPVASAGLLERVLSDEGAVVNPIGGERRCETFHGRDGEICVYLNYVMDAMYSHPRVDCRGESWDRRETCVGGQGAADHGWDTCRSPLSPAPDLCGDVDPADRDACLSGAYQGTSIDWSVAHCIESVVAICEGQFPDRAQRAACLEQSAAMVEGMPALPPATVPPPHGHEAWPAPWHGLLDRAVQLSSPPRQGDPGPSCEEVYLEQYASEVPASGGLAFDQCLTLARPYYPWCAIGVARQRGLTDCRWEGGLVTYQGHH